MQDTALSRWENIRSTSSNDTTPSVPKPWASVPAHSHLLRFKVTPRILANSNIKLRFRFSSGAGTTADYYVFTRQYGDDAEFVASGLATGGTFAATAGGTFADTITITAERHLKDVISTDESGNNEMARLGLDGCGAEYIEVYFDNISAGTVYVDIMVFS